nr:serine/arginine repetitive matrix protein 2-like [Lytechinus pictus]
MSLKKNPSFQEELSSKLKERKRRGLSTGFTSESEDSDDDDALGGLSDDDILSQFASKNSKKPQPSQSKPWEPPSTKQRPSPSPSPRSLTKSSSDAFPKAPPRNRGLSGSESPKSRKSAGSPDPIRALLGDDNGTKKKPPPKPSPRLLSGTTDSSPRSEDDSPRPQPRPRNKGPSEIDKLLGIASSPEPEKRKKSLFDEYDESQGPKGGSGKQPPKPKDRSKSPLMDMSGQRGKSSKTRSGSPERKSPNLDDLLGMKNKSKQGRASPELKPKSKSRSGSPERQASKAINDRRKKDNKSPDLDDLLGLTDKKKSERVSSNLKPKIRSGSPDRRGGGANDDQRKRDKSPDLDDLLGLRSKKNRSPSPERNRGKEPRSEIDDLLSGPSSRSKPRKQKGLLDSSSDEDDEVSKVNNRLGSMNLKQKGGSKSASPKPKSLLDTLADSEEEDVSSKRGRSRRSPSPQGFPPKPKPRVPQDRKDTKVNGETPQKSDDSRVNSRKNRIPGLNLDSDDDNSRVWSNKKGKQKQSLLDVLDDEPVRKKR